MALIFRPWVFLDVYECFFKQQVSWNIGNPEPHTAQLCFEAQLEKEEKQQLQKSQFDTDISFLEAITKNP